MSKRGRPRKHPRPQNCTHSARKEHERGVCYQCSSNKNNQIKREGKKTKNLRPEPLLSATIVPPLNYEEMHSQEYPRTTPDMSTSVALRPSDGLINFNIGGQLFTVTTKTVTHLLELPDKWEIEPDVFFFDRDPEHFRWILNYLRDKCLLSRPSTHMNRAELIIEARFYKLPHLESILLQPAFLYERPSSKGVFINNLKWEKIIPQLNVSGYISAQFHPNEPKITFMSLKYTESNNTIELEEVGTSDLKEAVNATTTLNIHFYTLYFEFRWVPKDQKSPPQLEMQIKSQWWPSTPYTPMFFLQPCIHL